MSQNVKIRIDDNRVINIPSDELVKLIKEWDENQYRVFSASDVKFMKSHDCVGVPYIKDVEKFCRDNQQLRDWKSHKLNRAYFGSNQRFPSLRVWVSNDGMVFQDLAAVSAFYGVDAEYECLTNFERYGIKAASKFLILCDKICLVPRARTSVCEDHGVESWDKFKETDPVVWKCCWFAGFIEYVMAVKEANDHLKKCGKRIE